MAVDKEEKRELAERAGSSRDRIHARPKKESCFTLVYIDIFLSFSFSFSLYSSWGLVGLVSWENGHRIPKFQQKNIYRPLTKEKRCTAPGTRTGTADGCL